MSGSSFLPPAGSSLCAGAGSVGTGGGAGTADDVFFVPDDTWYVGYDSVGAVWGRPRIVYATRGFVSSFSWAIGNTPTDGLTLTNTTPSTALMPTQFSPAITLSGTARETTGGTSQTVAWQIYTTPETGATVTAGSELTFEAVVDGVEGGTASILYDGTLTCYSGSFKVGAVPAGLATDLGITTVDDTDTLSLWSNRASGAGNVSIAAVADVNAASINASQHILSFQWVNNADAAAELAYIDGLGGYVNSRAWNILLVPTDGLTFVNTSPGTAVDGFEVQYSPAVHLGGQAWQTNTGSSHAVDWRIYNVPVTGVDASTKLYFDSSVNGAAYVNRMSLDSAGLLSVASLGLTTSLVVNSTSYLYGGWASATGLGTLDAVRTSRDAPYAIVNTARTDGASNYVIASVYDRNAASITNAATMRIHTFGWTNNADAYQELAYVRADGLVHGKLGFDATTAWAIGTTSTAGLTLANTTASTNPVQTQYAPAIVLQGTQWTGAVSQTHDWMIENEPTAGGSASQLAFRSRIAAAAFASRVTINQVGTVTANLFAGGYFSGNNSNFYLIESDESSGLGTGCTLEQVTTTPIILINKGRTDGASNGVIYSIYDRNAASITNAATMRIHSFGWTNNADAYTELQYMRADGAFVCATGSLSTGILPAGMSTDFGMATTAVTDTCSLWSIRTDGANNISNAIVADVNSATLNADHKVLSIGWVNNADVYTELFAFKDGQIVYSNVTGGMEFWSDEADGGAAVAFTVGSTSAWTTAGAKLFSVVNADPAGNERFWVGYNGDVVLNKGNNAQSLAIKSLTESLTLAAAATTNAVNQIPQYALVIGVSVRVTTVIPTAATFSVGVAGDVNRYGSGLNVAAGTTFPGTQDAARYYASATTLVITPNLTPGAATGVVRLTIHYLEVTPPSS